jgi:small subunit ribosomal protein S22
LDKACIQFEPDDPEFIRVAHRTYEYINEQYDFETLKATRFYGHMVFYLAYYKKIDNLLLHSLKKEDLKECRKLIELYFMIHSTSKTLLESVLPDINQASDLDVIKVCKV